MITKFMVKSKNKQLNRLLSVKNDLIPRVKSNTYLNTTITEDWNHSVKLELAKVVL